MWYYLGLVSLIAVILCVHDKRAARKGNRRVPEKVLFGISAIGGALFMYITMLTVRHKTKHFSFMFFIPVMIVAQVALLIWLQIKFGIVF